jgi:hypothetical protein
MKKLGGWFDPTATRMTTRASHANTTDPQPAPARSSDHLGGDDDPSVSMGDQSGRDNSDPPDSASIMIDRAHPDFCPDLAFAEISEAYDKVDLDKLEEPKKYYEAWDHPETYQREKWRDAIRKEFRDMETRKVWKKIKRRDMPRGRRCVKNKWVFKIKRNGVF